MKKFASVRDVEVTHARSHSRRTHTIQFNRDDQIAVIRTLQPSVPKSEGFMKIYYADLFSIAIAYLSRCMCAGISMRATFYEIEYDRIAKILKIKIFDPESKSRRIQTNGAKQFFSVEHL